MAGILSLPDGVQITATKITPQYAEILTPEALAFLAKLQRQFGSTRETLLAKRIEQQHEIDAGKFPDFLPETQKIRESEWKVAPPPKDLIDRRVEITGPVTRNMIINALNSGAKVFKADFEDACSPSWSNLLDGQVNLRDANNRRIDFVSPEGKEYRLNAKTATLMMRPRGWHYPEKHVLVDGKPMSGSLFDWGLYFFHNAKTLIANGSGPYFYLPKMESYLEARLWNDVFLFAQAELSIPRGTIRATVLIEIILTSFECEEILWELREHSAGINAGRWDYMFSFIKKFRNQPAFLFPDRSAMTMTTPFMRAYALNVIKCAHKRGAHAIGGMAAQIPIRDNPVANEAALEKVRIDKEREVTDGNDGTWVAHPGLVATAKAVFDKHMPTPNQIHRQLDTVNVTTKDLLAVPAGKITERGLRHNINIGIQYLEAWLGGSGAVALYNVMEDVATAEISRSQIWQWIKFGAKLDDGRQVTLAMYETMLPEELAKIKAEVGEERFTSGHYQRAAELFTRMTKNKDFDQFLTLPAYEYLE
ncbi:MAG: Malate synthase A [Verrucomicrobiae bacterium]|nr:Malate synthase A [Verrucomicrobiae bacterium]